MGNHRLKQVSQVPDDRVYPGCYLRPTQVDDNRYSASTIDVNKSIDRRKLRHGFLNSNCPVSPLLALAIVGSSWKCAQKTKRVPLGRDVAWRHDVSC